MTTTIPEFPMARADRCPFDPPHDLRDLQKEGPLAKVRLKDGSSPSPGRAKPDAVAA